MNILPIFRHFQPAVPEHPIRFCERNDTLSSPSYYDNYATQRHDTLNSYTNYPGRNDTLNSRSYYDNPASQRHDTLNSQRPDYNHMPSSSNGPNYQTIYNPSH